MKIKFLNPLLISFLILSACGGKYSEFPLEKRYWTPEDYDEVVRTLRFKTGDDEKLPTFEDPESRIILEKLTNRENYLVILDDDELGLKYRNEVAQKFFSEWRGMNQIYWHMNRQDKYLYPIELVECFKFGLGLQIKYFKLGNDNIIENSVDPNSFDTKRIMGDNIKTLVENFEIYLNIVNKESAFSDKALRAYSQGVDEYFAQLIETYQNANYSGIKKKMELLKQKLNSDYIINSYDSIIQMIDSKNLE